MQAARALIAPIRNILSPNPQTPKQPRSSNSAEQQNRHQLAQDAASTARIEEGEWQYFQSRHLFIDHY
jgi:hypothetical protein